MDHGIIEIELRSYEKYKARSDVKRPSWFKCSNQLFEDDDLFDFTLEEMAVWTYIMAQSSKQQSKRIRLSIRKASARISPALLKGTIEKLVGLGILSYHVTDAVRARNVDVPDTDGIRTLEERREEEIRREERGGDKRPPPPLEASPHREIEELSNSPLMAAVLEDVSHDLQAQWLAKYEPLWLKESLLRAVQHHLKKERVDAVQAVHGWQKRLDSWFSQERRPRLRAPPRPVARPGPSPESLVNIPESTPEDVERARRRAEERGLKVALSKLDGGRAS